MMVKRIKPKLSQTSTHMQIEIAKTSDIPMLAELLSTLFEQEAEFKPDREAQRRGLALIIENPDIGVIMVTKRQNTAIAMVNLLFTVSTALGERVALLEDMIVSPDARGTGVGAKLMQSAIAHARMAGCKRITLLTDESNVKAQRFYITQGFTKSPMIPFRLLLE